MFICMYVCIGSTLNPNFRTPRVIGVNPQKFETTGGGKPARTRAIGSRRRLLSQAPRHIQESSGAPLDSQSHSRLGCSSAYSIYSIGGDAIHAI